jgi:hypothetical protein
MPITPFLIGHPFEPEDIQKMSEAFIVACEKLRLTDRTDPLTEIVARKINAARHPRPGSAAPKDAKRIQRPRLRPPQMSPWSLTELAAAAAVLAGMGLVAYLVYGLIAL